MQNNYFELFNYILTRETQGINLFHSMMIFIVEAIIIFGLGAVLHKLKGVSFIRIFHFFLITVYFTVIIIFTILRRPFGSTVGEVHLDIKLGFGLKGYGISRWSGTLSFLNILLFVPYGVLICSYLKDKSSLIKICKTTIIGMITSIFVEYYQLVTATGRFELTDIVTNTTGSFFGALFIVLVLKWLSIRKRNIK